jgi:hypothetical protein
MRENRMSGIVRGCRVTGIPTVEASAMIRALIALAPIVALMLTGTECRAEHAQELEVFRSVKIEAHPKGWGYAHKTVTADGIITGAHMSGGPDAVRVYETKDKLTLEDLNSLRSLTVSLHDTSSPSGSTVPDQKAEGYTSVTIHFDDGKTITVHANWGSKLEPSSFQAVWELIYKYQVGAW